MMSRTGLLAACLALSALVVSPTASAIKNQFGIGIALGQPTAVDFKWRPNHVIGFNFGVGAHHFSRNLAVYADFEFGIVDFRAGVAEGTFYLGPGLQLGVTNDDHYYGFHKESGGGTYLGVMMPIGVEFGFKFPLEIFVELRPGIVVLHAPGVFDFGGQLGFRYGF